MNIFFLDKNPIRCAQMHVDKHCVKMILEYAQLLSTAHRVLDGTQSVGLSKTGRKQTRYVLPDDREHTLYSATHISHPSAVWARQSDSNYMWLAELLEECCKEYTYRYGKIHKVESSDLMQTLKNIFPKNIPNKPFTEPTPAMPDECKVPGNSLQSYHNYYVMNKQHLWSWKGKINSRNRPQWFNEMMMQKLHDTNQELGLIY
jgi:hypothetical protein